MVTTAKCAAPLDGEQVLGFFDDTDDPFVPFAAANAAGIILRNAETGGTESDLIMHFEKAPGQIPAHRGRLEDMKGQPERGPVTDARQFFQLPDELGQGLRKMYHIFDKK
jgi:hypothetical protein